MSALRAQAALAASLAERSASFEEEVGRRGRRIDELGAALAQLKEISNGAHQALQETRDALAQVQESSNAAHQALQETSDALHRANAVVVDLQNDRAALEARLRAIENSRSWRLTAPLRRILGVARGAAPDTSTGAATSSVPAHDRMHPHAPPVEPVPPLQPAAEEPDALAPSAPPRATPHLAPGQSQADSLSTPPLPSARPSIVVVSHDAHFYGAQRLALFLVKTLARDMGYDVEVLLCGGGPLVQEFAATGRVHDFYSASSTPENQAEVIRGLYDRGARIAICNTSCVGDVVHALKGAGFSVVSLIHELPGLIGQYGLEDSIATISREADKVVFAAEVVRDRFVELTGLSLDKAVVRPQGLLLRNRYTNGAEARRELRERLGVERTHEDRAGGRLRAQAQGTRPLRRSRAFGHRDADGRCIRVGRPYRRRWVRRGVGTRIAVGRSEALHLSRRHRRFRCLLRRRRRLPDDLTRGSVPECGPARARRRAARHRVRQRGRVRRAAATRVRNPGALPRYERHGGRDLVAPGRTGRCPGHDRDRKRDRVT